MTAELVVRRRWNDDHSARVLSHHVRGVRVQSDPGGVCGALPRPFLHARIWCDHLIEGAGIHTCDPASAPHELDLCILDRDNPPELMAALRPARGRPVG